MLFELDSENSDILNNLDYFNLNKNQIENKYKYAVNFKRHKICTFMPFKNK